jgi:hypothetical protein
MSSTVTIGPSGAQHEPFCEARGLGAEERGKLGVQALAGVETITALALANGVSRKFVSEQKSVVQEAVEQVFAARNGEGKVLFTLPVTQKWLEQFMLELVLVGRSSTRAVWEIIADLFPTTVAVGTIHNVVRTAALAACAANAQEDLSGIRVGAHDEIFQAGQPVLGGVDVRSTYCYLLHLATGRGETDWGVPLLELGAKGLHLSSTIADFAPGLRAGQAAAWPGVRCDGDVFHVTLEAGRVATYLEHRALGAMARTEHLAAKMRRAKKKQRGQHLSAQLGAARREESAAVQVADDVACLVQWLREDVLALVGADLATRQELYDWIVAELRLREPQAPHRLGPLCGLLENWRAEILGFVAALEEQLAGLAGEFQVATATVRQVYELEGWVLEDPRRWEQEAVLRRQLGARFHLLQAAVQNCLEQVVRASSVVENLNSRLRCYFYLRRELGPLYLELLRFFLNHRRFQRSRRSERVGRSPAEILTGQTHPHWLTMLGYPLLEQAA